MPVNVPHLDHWAPHASAAREAVSVAALEQALIYAGWMPARPTFDAGVDLLAYRPTEGHTMVLQLKGRPTLDQKYLGRGIKIVWPDGMRFLAFDHDRLLKEAKQRDKVAKTKSWNEVGRYSWRATPRWLVHVVEADGLVLPLAAAVPRSQVDRAG